MAIRSGASISSIKVTGFQLTESTGSSVAGKSVAVYAVEVAGRTRLLHPMCYFAGTNEFTESPVFHCKIRYRDLHQLNQDLVRRFPSVKFPQFPPKKWFGNKSEEFLAKRTLKLHAYFQQLLTIREVANGESIALAAQPVASWDLLVVGYAKIGKAQFIKRFLHHRPFAADVPPHWEHLVSHLRISDVSSAVMPDSTAFSEIEQFTPVDLIVDGWLVRINSFQLLETTAQTSVSDLRTHIRSKDAVFFMYKHSSRGSECAAEALEAAFRGEKVVEKVALPDNSEHDALVQLETGEFAYNTVVQMLRRLLLL